MLVSCREEPLLLLIFNAITSPSVSSGEHLIAFVAIPCLIVLKPWFPSVNHTVVGRQAGATKLATPDLLRAFRSSSLFESFPISS